MTKRNQINLTVDDAEMHNIREYCRTHGSTPQGLLRTGVQRLIQEDILERQADLRTLQAWREIGAGRSESVDGLIAMLEEDLATGDDLITTIHKPIAQAGE